jgi:hypothetical protein
VKDSRFDLLAGMLPAAPQPTDPAGSVMLGADLLADMDPNLTVGEANLILAALADSWGMAVEPRDMSKAAQWCVGLAKGRSSGQGNDELSDHLKDQASGRYALASWPWPVLTRESRSLMPGSVTIVCGTPGASKSWFALSCIRHWIAEGVPSAVLMLEETRKWHLQRGLAQCAGDPKLLYPEWVASHKEAAMETWQRHRDELAIVGSHLTCDGDVTLAACASWVEERCKEGKRVIIVDPISLADPGSEKGFEADRKFMARAKVAIEKSGTSLILITHPRKGGGGKVQGPPTLDDLAGGAAYGRACASALWVAGIDQREPVPVITEAGEYRTGVPAKMIKILKARNSTGCGKTIAYTFDDLRFEELGEIAGNKQPKPPQATRLRSKPHAGEDAFADQ